MIYEQNSRRGCVVARFKRQLNVCVCVCVIERESERVSVREAYVLEIP